VSYPDSDVALFLWHGVVRRGLSCKCWFLADKKIAKPESEFRMEIHPGMFPRLGMDESELVRMAFMEYAKA